MNKPRFITLIALTLSLSVSSLYSTSMLRRNVGELIGLSELIVVGTVIRVTDGFQGTVPYTEVTIKLSKSILGGRSGSYTFRQFGLLKPRDMGNGMINANVSPDGWPRFEEGEEVMTFLYKAGGMTGFRTTVGLFQGKFNIKNGKITNALDNVGLFQNVSVSAALSKQERSLLQSKKGPVESEAFIDFVTRAVNERWFK